MTLSESALQAHCVEWFRFSLPRLSKCFFSIPNGGKRGIKTAIAMKKEGLLAGVCDTFLSVPNEKYHGLYIEFKTKTSLSVEQKEFISAMKEMGYRCEVVKKAEQFEQLIQEYLWNTDHLKYSKNIQITHALSKTTTS